MLSDFLSRVCIVSSINPLSTEILTIDNEFFSSKFIFYRPILGTLKIKPITLFIIFYTYFTISLSLLYHYRVRLSIDVYW